MLINFGDVHGDGNTCMLHGLNALQDRMESSSLKARLHFVPLYNPSACLEIQATDATCGKSTACAHLQRVQAHCFPAIHHHCAPCHARIDVRVCARQHSQPGAKNIGP